MPWDLKDVERHIHGLSKRQKQAWVKIANNALGEYGDDAAAIRIANAKAKRVGKKTRKRK